MDFPLPLLLILFLTYIMITLHLTVSNYSESFIELSLCAEDKVLTSQQIDKYLWKYNNNSHAMLSRDGESFEEFKNRVQTIYPYMEGWHHRYSEFKEIY